MSPRNRLAPHRLPIDEPSPNRERCYETDPISGKLRFDDERSALDEADRIFRRDGTDLVVYFCLYCNGWHFSSANRRRS
ncbi:MAG: hypothetical protein V1738_00225 [Patescibacteria group bacterium]